MVWWFIGPVVKNPPYKAEDSSLIPGLGRILRLLCKRRPMHSKEDPAQPKIKNRNKLIKKMLSLKWFKIMAKKPLLFVFTIAVD